MSGRTILKKSLGLLILIAIAEFCVHTLIHGVGALTETDATDPFANAFFLILIISPFIYKNFKKEKRISDLNLSLKESEGKYHLLFEENPAPMWVCDVESLFFLDVNDAACRHYGYGREEFLRMKVTEIRPPEEVPRLLGIIHSIPSDLQFAGVWKHRKKDGSLMDMEMMAKRVDYNGKSAILAIANDVTGKIRSEAALKENEKRFREVLESVRLVAVTLDREGRVVFSNDFLSDLTGWSREELEGQDWFRMFIPPERQDVREVFRKMIEDDDFPAHYENPIITRSGRERLISWNNTVFRDTDGKALGITCLGEDISDWSEAEAAVLKTNERLAMLNRIDKAMASNPQFEGIAEVLLESLAGALNMESGAFYAFDPASDSLTVEKCFNYGCKNLGACLSLSCLPGARHAIERREPAAVERLEESSQFGQSSGIKSYLLLPLIHKDRLHGIIGIFNTAREHSFTGDELSFARQVADQAVIAIMNAELIQDLKEREASLIETNTELAALNGISSIIAETLDLNVTLQRVLDKTLSFPFLELQKKGVIFVEDDEEPGTFVLTAGTGVASALLEHEKTIKAGHCLCGLAAQTGEAVYSEDCFSDPRHTTHYPGMHEHGHVILPLKSKDRVLGVMALYLTSGARVTGFESQLLTGIASQLAVAIENRRLFQSILTGKKEWEATFDSIEDAITIHGPDYRVLRANKAAARLVGLRPQDMIGRKCYELFHAATGPIDSCPAEKLFGGKAESLKGEYEAGGRSYEVNVYPIKQKDGLTAIVHVVKDVTDRRLAHKALVRRLTIEGAISEASSLLLSGGNIDFEVILAIIGESIGMEKACLLFRDEESGTVQEVYCWNNEGGDHGRDALKSLGRPAFDSWVAGLKERQEILVEDGSALPAGADAERAILAALDVKSFLAVPLRHGEKLHGFIGFGTSGEKSWSREEVSFIQYAAHDILSYIDRTKAEKALKESEEKFRKLVEQSLVGVYIMQDSRYRYINPRFAEIFGYEFGEVIDRLGPHEIILPEYWPAIDDSVRRRMEGDMTFAHYEFLGIRKNRDVISVEVYCSGTMYNGRPALIGTLTDVTEQKQYERKLNDQARYALLAADIGTALASGASLRPTLQECTDAMVVRLDATLARIWTFNEKEGVLELQASSGIYTNIDGTHSRIPLGKYRVGVIGAKREAYLTNDMLDDPLMEKWARREGVTAFAGYPLVIENKLLGVMAIFARTALPQPTLKALGSVADIIAVGIEGRKIETKLKESEKKFRNLVERSLTGVYIIQDGVFRYVNPRFAEIFEYKDPSLIDGVLSPQDIASPEDKAFVEENVRKCSSGDVKALNYIFRGITRNGRAIKVEVYDSNTVFDGSPAVIGTLMDITERIKAQEELIGREREMAMLQQAKKQIEEISRLKSEFLANMSHELRTPLNAVIGLSNILLDETFGPLMPKQSEYLKGINSSGEHLLSLINEILDLSKIEAGKEELECAAFSLADTLKNSFLLVKEKAIKHRIELHSGISPEVGAFYGDERRIKQIIFNLLSNAIKFTEPGGKVGITAFAADGEVSITVWDTGIGIPEEKKHLLFQPFQQLDSSLSKKHEGTGLGLVLTKKLVEMHGGRITFDSSEGKGSSFTVCLPLKEGARPDAKARAVHHNSHGQMPLPISKTILVVEDNELNMLLASDFLRSKGFSVTEAMDGESALEMVREAAPDLILMDIQMPGIDGLEVAKRLKSVPATRRIPIIAMTALAMKGDEEMCMKCGCDGYLKKPVNLKEMLEAVNSHLTGKKRTDV